MKVGSDSRQAPADVLDLRRRNLSQVLHHLRDRGRSSRIEVAADTGLAAGAVTSLISELIDAELVQEAGLSGSGAAGRPRRLLTLAGGSVAAVGVQVDAETVAVRIIDLVGRELYSGRHAHAVSDFSDDALARAAAAHITSALDTAGGDRLTIAVTVAVPGWPHEGLVVSPTLGWAGNPFLDDLRTHLGCPTGALSLANDGNLGALAEYQLLRPTGVRDLVYMEGGVGIGGGVIVDGRQAFGAAGAAGEFGHVVVDPQGPACLCGQRGCLERYASLPVLLERTGLRAQLRERGANASLAELVRLARAGTLPVLDALSDIARHLNVVTAAAQMIINPHTIVLGGYFAQVAPWLISAMTRQAAPLIMSPNIRPGALSVDAPLHGAALSATNAILDDPLRITRPSSGRTG
ncbi:ROK family protein [Nonomuraea insulae]|uniref:ROK family protein n=1 Tax=Nonomuraea insulae TaxID=1616787 RepID=A0ABW1D5J9_9ACTN